MDPWEACLSEEWPITWKSLTWRRPCKLSRNKSQDWRLHDETRFKWFSNSHINMLQSAFTISKKSPRQWNHSLGDFSFVVFRFYHTKILKNKSWSSIKSAVDCKFRTVSDFLVPEVLISGSSAPVYLPALPSGAAWSGNRPSLLLVHCFDHLQRHWQKGQSK